MPPTSIGSWPISSATSPDLRDGFLPVDKPSGPTSHDVGARVRKAFGTRRVGHSGTLDPFATGLLLVLVGRATRLAQFLSGLPKRYEGIIRLGLATSTDDPTGEPLQSSDAWRALSEDDVAGVMQTLTGRQQQQPPIYSAKKVGGRPAHRRARQGEALTLAAEWVDIAQFRLMGRHGADLAFEAEVGSGVYLRAMARDLGERLGCGAHLLELRRLAIGPFSVEEAVTLEEVVHASPKLRPSGEVVRHLESVEIDDAGRAAVRQGRAIPGAPASLGPVALRAGPDLIAIAQPEGGLLYPRVVLDP
jgi:tRNA pseudouridine55 synthase